jgi:hypothetical protein
MPGVRPLEDSSANSCRPTGKVIGVAVTKASQKVLLLPRRLGDIPGSRSKRNEAAIESSGGHTVVPNMEIVGLDRMVIQA